VFLSLSLSVCCMCLTVISLSLSLYHSSHSVYLIVLSLSLSPSPSKLQDRQRWSDEQHQETFRGGCLRRHWGTSVDGWRVVVFRFVMYYHICYHFISYICYIYSLLCIVSIIMSRTTNIMENVVGGASDMTEVRGKMFNVLLYLDLLLLIISILTLFMNCI